MGEEEAPAVGEGEVREVAEEDSEVSAEVLRAAAALQAAGKDTSVSEWTRRELNPGFRNANAVFYR